MPHTRRVVLVDEQPLFRLGLRTLLDAAADFAVVGEADGFLAAIRAVEAHQPDIVVVDLALSDGSGLELLKQLRAKAPNAAVLVLSQLDEGLWAERSLRSGASGFLSKRDQVDAVLAALRTLRSGGVALNTRSQTALVARLQGGRLQDPDDTTELSDREFEVFKLMADGLPNREIATTLRLSVKTVETHQARLKRKLNATDNYDLRRRAVLWAQRQEAGGATAPARAVRAR